MSDNCEIENMIIELNILSKFGINEKPRIRNNKLEIDQYSIVQRVWRLYYGDTFDKSLSHINNIANKIKIICKDLNDLSKAHVNNNIEKFKDIHYANYINQITKNLINCVEYGLYNLINTYYMDKSKLSHLENIRNIFIVQIDENFNYVNDETKKYINNYKQKNLKINNVNKNLDIVNTDNKNLYNINTDNKIISSKSIEIQLPNNDEITIPSINNVVPNNTPNSPNNFDNIIKNITKNKR